MEAWFASDGVVQLGGAVSGVESVAGRTVCAVRKREVDPIEESERFLAACTASLPGAEATLERGVRESDFPVLDVGVPELEPRMERWDGGLDESPDGMEFWRTEDNDFLPCEERVSSREGVERLPTRLDLQGGELLPGECYDDRELSEFTFPKIVVGANGVTPEQGRTLRELVWSFRAIFSSRLRRDPARLPKFSIAITPGCSPPAAQRARRLAPPQRKFVQGEVAKYVEMGVIRPSSSAHAQPIVVASKKATPPDAPFRMCADLTKLNLVTVRSAFPQTNAEDFLNALSGASLFAAFDMTAGYHQIEVDPASIALLAFVTPDGQYEWLRVPCGPMNAADHFQRCMTTIVLADLINKIAECYLDDVAVPAKSFSELLARCRAVFERCAKYGVLLHPRKAVIGARELVVLGHVVGPHGIALTLDRKQAIRDFPAPTKVAGVRRFLGLLGYFRRFVKGMAVLAKPLTRLTGKSVPWSWARDGPEQKAFEALVSACVDCPMLRFVDPERPLYIRADASIVGCGGVVFQVHEGRELPCRFVSHAFSPVESRWPTIEQEAFAVYYTMIKNEFYVRGRRADNTFLITDHRNLIFMANSVSRKVERWYLRLAGDFQYTLLHEAGTRNVISDALSRCFHVAMAPVDGAEAAALERARPALRAAVFALSARQEETAAAVVSSGLREVSGARSRVVGVVTRRQAAAAAKATEPAAAVPSQVVAVPAALGETWGVVAAPSLSAEESSSEAECVVEEDAVLASVPATLAAAVDAAHVELFRSTHNELLGHHGVERTLAKFRTLGHVWPGMRQDVMALVAACPTCQKGRLRRSREQVSDSSIAVYEPWHTLSMDFVGPFVEDVDGNSFILVLIDTFTRWAELFVCRNASALSAARGLLATFGRYGAFSVVRSDQGPHFTAGAVREFLRLMGTSQTFSIAYRPESNGVVERCIGEVVRHLRALVFDLRETTTWSAYVPLVARVLNATPSASTGFSPAQLLYGGAVDLDRGFLSSLVSEQGDSGGFTHAGYIDGLRTEQRRLMDAAALFQRAVVGRRQQASPGVVMQFKVGDYVLVQPPKRRHKLASRWDGPMQVLEVTGSNSLLLRDLVSGRERVVAAAHLKLFDVSLSENAAALALAVASADSQEPEFEVDHIVEHCELDEDDEGRPLRGEQRLRFRVRFAGYPPSEDLWYVIEEVRELSAFGTYVSTNPGLLVD